MRMSRLLWMILCLAIGGSSTSYAQVQSDFDRSRYSSASYYNYAEPADVTMFVSVWGTVRNPGLYELPEQTSLSHLLSLSGGPIVAERERRQDRSIHVRVFREGAAGQELVFETKMDNEVIAIAGNPALRPGDVVSIETVIRRRFSWRDAFPIIAAIGTVAIAVERLASNR